MQSRSCTADICCIPAGLEFQTCFSLLNCRQYRLPSVFKAEMCHYNDCFWTGFLNTRLIGRPHGWPRPKQVNRIKQKRVTVFRGSCWSDFLIVTHHQASFEHSNEWHASALKLLNVLISGLMSRNRLSVRFSFVSLNVLLWSVWLELLFPLRSGFEELVLYVFISRWFFTLYILN